MTIECKTATITEKGEEESGGYGLLETAAIAVVGIAIGAIAIDTYKSW